MPRADGLTSNLMGVERYPLEAADVETGVQHQGETGRPSEKTFGQSISFADVPTVNLDQRPPLAPVQQHSQPYADSHLDESVHAACPSQQLARPAEATLAAVGKGASRSNTQSIWDGGSKLLVLLFVLIGAVLLGLALVPGAEVALLSANKCSANFTCTYEHGFALGHRTTPLASLWVDNTHECCHECGGQADCAVATFLGKNATLPMANCFLYRESSAADKIATKGAQICSMPTSSDGALLATVRGSLQRKLQTLLGASSIITRFAGIGMVYVQGWLLRQVGYNGAGLGQSILVPRRAAVVHEATELIALEAIKKRKGSSGSASSEIPVVATWDAIVALNRDALRSNALERPSSWAEARVGLGLSVRQAVWSCGNKLLLWHWSQPLAYLAVFGAYYCSLDGIAAFGFTARGLGIVVAVREATYLVYTILALWLNPAFLLLELESVLQPVEDHEALLQQWVLYLLAPNHYVTMCVWRSARARWGKAVGFVLILGWPLQCVCDLASVLALLSLLAKPSPPTPLVIGYWFTTCGLVVATCGFGLHLRKRKKNGSNFYFFVALIGANLVVLTPLQLTGVVRGLVPPCDTGVLPWGWLCYLAS